MDDALLRLLANLTCYLNWHRLMQLPMRFSPLPDGIPINYSTSTNDLLFRMDAFGSEPMVHLSSVNHLYLNRLYGWRMNQVWVRFAGLQSLRRRFIAQLFNCASSVGGCSG